MCEGSFPLNFGKIFGHIFLNYVSKIVKIIENCSGSLLQNNLGQFSGLRNFLQTTYRVKRFLLLMTLFVHFANSSEMKFGNVFLTRQSIYI